MLELARKRNIAVSFITNGSLLTEAAVQKIVAMGTVPIWPARAAVIQPLSVALRPALHSALAHPSFCALQM